MDGGLPIRPPIGVAVPTPKVTGRPDYGSDHERQEPSGVAFEYVREQTLTDALCC